MSELKFNSQVCTTKEQSQRLLELGLKPETADMVHMQIDGSWICIISQGDEEYIPYEDHFPAWSLHRLMEILDSPLIEFNTLTYNPYEEIIYNISECIKNGYISKEYLKQ